MGWRERIARALFGDVIDAAVKREVAAVTVRVDDSPGWESHTRAGPADRDWPERYTDLEEVLEAWRKNFLVRRITNLVRSYVVGPGLEISSKHGGVDRFARAFWEEPRNRIARRLGPMCDELTRAGELFPILFTNRVNGMSYVRFMPASWIPEVETDADDYEVELRYGQRQRDTTELKWWLSPEHPDAGGNGGRLPPVMLHFSVNKVIGATRGEGDLGPVLRWVKRYNEWLEDRVRLNRQRTRQAMLSVEIADDSQVEQKREQLRAHKPMEAGIYVHGRGETVMAHDLQIRADDVESDGKVLRLAVATGSNLALHYLGEGESTNYATAKEMGEPTARFYADRQQELGWFVCDLTEAAYMRAVAAGVVGLPRGGFQWVVSAPEVARADNEALARAAKGVVEAFALARDRGWIDDATAVRLAFKFAGEPLGEDAVFAILEQARAEMRAAGEAASSSIGDGENSED